MIGAKTLQGGQKTSQGEGEIFVRASREIIAPPDQNPVYVPAALVFSTRLVWLDKVGTVQRSSCTGLPIVQV